MRARIRLRLVEGAYALLVGGIIGAGGGLVLYVGVRAVQQGRITLGELLLVMGYLTQLYAPIKTMARKAGSLQEHLASVERCFALLDEAPEVPERPAARPLARASGAVEFRAVSFAYVPDRPVLEEVSFTVKPGTRVGIAGATGAGKTTLMNLLTRFYDPTSGQIFLDGVDLRDYRLADVRNQLGIVLQEPVLFSTTIFDNIAYARPDATQNDIEAAAAAANIHDFIVALPDGYATQVGERGMGLSGGERQRISLARAFLKDAPILILDEPTSSVDVNTEAVIMEAMERLMSGRTSFMIAHRLSTLDVCDLRLEIDEGRIAHAPPAQARTGAGAREDAARRTESAAPSTRRSLHGCRWAARGRTTWTVLKSKRFRKRGVYRLEGAGPGGSPVIAKICKRKTAEVEIAVYEELLPRLPVPSLRYYGNVPDEDRQHCWLFMEDAGTERYSPADPEHRRVAARWLATVQLHAAEFVRHVRPARQGTAALPGPPLQRPRRDRAAPAPAEQRQPTAPGVLADLLYKLDVLESHWAELSAFCDTLPDTVVHGDLVPKNLRILGDGDSPGLAIFDWETAGLGVQAPDLAQLLEPERSRSAAPIEAARSLLRESLPRHLPLRARRFRNGARTPRPSSNRQRSETCSGAWPASTGPARRATAPGIRWMTSASTRSGLATPCGLPDGDSHGEEILAGEMTAGQPDVTLDGVPELQTCLREALGGRSVSTHRSASG